MLVIKGYARPDEQDQPAKVEPEHEHYENREAGVDSRVLGGGHDKGSERPTGGSPQNTSYHRTG